MQHIYGPAEVNGIDGAIRVAIVILHNLQHPGTRSLPWFRGGVFPAKLSDAQCSANAVLTASGNASKSRFAEPTQYKGCSPKTSRRNQALIPVLGYHRYDQLGPIAQKALSCLAVLPQAPQTLDGRHEIIRSRQRLGKAR